MESDEFERLAREYCALIEDPPDREELVSRLVELLPRLYAAAVHLQGPFVDDDLPRMSHEGWVMIFERLEAVLGDWDLYPEIFDPTDPSLGVEPVHGSLADDLADIYRDVRNTLAGGAYDRRLQFDIHWGDHAVDALRVLHRRRYG